MTERSTFKSVLGAACVGIVIGALAFSLTVSGQTNAPVLLAQAPDGKVPDIQLGTPKSGTATSRRDQTVVIDRTTYTLAYDLMIQQPDGSPLRYEDFVGDNLEYPVVFWLGVGTNSNKIVKMVVYFPR